MIVQQLGEYLTATQVGSSGSGKTQVWSISGRHDRKLGEVRWFARWRQYGFFPEPQTIFNHGCLTDVAEFCRRLTAEHRHA